jgi:amino acid adenylation domain-containing protein
MSTNLPSAQQHGLHDSRLVPPGAAASVPVGSNTNPSPDLRPPASSERCVHQRVEWQAQQHPHATAVTCKDYSLTYGELNARADELAHHLCELGVSPGSVVGLCMWRSAAMLAGALGILKAGGAYLPIDPTDPRLQLMLEDAGASVLVIARCLKEKARGAHHCVLALDDSGRVVDAPPSAPAVARPVEATAKDLAYVIYTSGSTGTPKGVEVTHESLSNLVSWHQAAFKVASADRASHLARIGFDAGVWEIWPYLTAGATLLVPEEESLNDPKALQEWLLAQAITLSFLPTPMAEQLLALDWPAQTPLRVMLTGGDTLHSYPPTLPFLLVNNYGPTECTVVAVSGLVSAEGSANRLPPIGRPIAGTELHILDDSLNPVPAEIPGEIYIGGVGVARGYRNRPELTTERFVPNPFGGGSERLFKTGDLGAYLPDGQIAFLGRLDDQVKIRGFRVEPNEIVAALNGHPAVSQSVVVAREVNPGDRRLVAYLVAVPDGRLTLSDLRDFLGARLPNYMIPATLVLLDSLPVTPNGKVDRAALPTPNDANSLRDDAFRSPQTELERTVAGILAPLLGIQEVDVEANFFLLGGHSLLGIQLISRLRDCLGVELSLRTVFQAPSIAELSAEIEKLLRARVEAMSEDEVQRTLQLADADQ